MATWKVEGLRGDSLVKLEELLHTMRNNSIDILCGQETHLHGAEYSSKNDHKLFFSGSLDVQNRTYAGVGFLVGPSVVNSVIAFKACDDRIATLRVKISGGVLTFISAYAPHSGLEYEVRQDFHTKLQSTIRATTTHSATYILGDLNA